MSDLKANSSPRRFVSLEALMLIAILGITGSGVYFLQQQRIERLQAQNQALQQQIASLQADNINQQQAIEGLNSAKSTLTANLQLLCQQPQTRISLFFKKALGGLMDNGSSDFAETWQQVCGNALPSTPLQ
ncbi:MAG: hypothetical protein HC827_19690 [Cyanobacteria bacterium RM1_2_2]|nr:hypothetical protein [Cyanobacteria bacterium RM1_2_2]